MKQCSKCGKELPDETRFCPECGADVRGDSGYEKPADSTPSPLDYPMKWHNFLMVVMIIGAILTMISGATTMAGMQYERAGVSASRVYAYYDGLKTCDMCYGIATIAIGVFQIITRNRLKQFRSNGPSSLRILYILGIVVSIVYVAWASSIAKINLMDASYTGSLISNVVMLIANSVYYSKRSALFVN